MMRVRRQFCSAEPAETAGRQHKKRCQILTRIQKKKGMEMKQCLRYPLLKACLALSIFGAAVPATQAATAAPIVAQPIVNQVNALQGDAREKFLIDAAKKEGALNIYHINIEDIPVIAAAFSKKYGIKVSLWRSSSEMVTNRLVTEAQGGRFEADIVDTNGPGMEALSREKMLQPVKSPYEKDLIALATPKTGDWIATTVDVFVQAYNTDKIKKADLPKSYQDLLNPKWKGMLTVEEGDQAWFEMVAESMGREKGMQLFKDIVAKNGISVRKGHSLLGNLIVSGDVPMGLTLYRYNPELLKRKGAPIDWFIIPPAIGQTRGIAMLRKVQHPYAAMLFYDFMLNEGEQIYADRAQYPTSKKIKGNAGNLKITYIDTARNLDEDAQWTKDYENVITKAK
jgi:iron(III) transport system substrate-binding protein